MIAKMLLNVQQILHAKKIIELLNKALRNEA